MYPFLCVTNISITKANNGILNPYKHGALFISDQDLHCLLTECSIKNL